MKITCCGSEMKMKIETLNYEEYECPKCGDVVYVKKAMKPKPQIIDD